MQPYPARDEGDKPPKCLAPGIVVLVIGILEFFAMVACLIIVAVLVPDGGASARAAAPGWWIFGLSSALFIVTGSLAIASARGKKNCHVAGIIFSSVTLVWSLINGLIFGFTLSAVQPMARFKNGYYTSSFVPQENQTTQTILSVTELILIAALLVLILLVACDIGILVLISKATCCTRRVESRGFIFQEAPSATETVHVYPYVQPN